MSDNTSTVAAAEPIVMYLIVRESLGMSIGKTAAQCAHASQMLQIQFEELKSKDLCGWCEGTDKYNIELFNKWLDTSYRKVVLKASEKEWGKLKELMTDTDVLVIDAGLTEIPSNTETVIGLFPIKKSSVNKTIKRLQVLK